MTDRKLADLQGATTPSHWTKQLAADLLNMNDDGLSERAKKARKRNETARAENFRQFCKTFRDVLFFSLSFAFQSRQTQQIAKKKIPNY